MIETFMWKYPLFGKELKVVIKILECLSIGLKMAIGELSCLALFLLFKFGVLLNIQKSQNKL